MRIFGYTPKEIVYECNKFTNLIGENVDPVHVNIIAQQVPTYSYGDNQIPSCNMDLLRVIIIPHVSHDFGCDRRLFIYQVYCGDILAATFGVELALLDGTVVHEFIDINDGAMRCANRDSSEFNPWGW